MYLYMMLTAEGSFEEGKVSPKGVN